MHWVGKERNWSGRLVTRVDMVIEEVREVRVTGYFLKWKFEPGCPKPILTEEVGRRFNVKRIGNRFAVGSGSGKNRFILDKQEMTAQEEHHAEKV